ncbi:MAG: sporulation protein YqfD, partial [Oscillospiraceae bacterium]|nr:sporulation protein YqfD [Oscillospiraceae bacterium]
DIRTPTGKSKSFYTLCAFSKNINLFPNENIPFGEYDTANTVYTVPELFGYTIPLSLSRTKVGEVTVSRVRITEKNAADRARELIEDDISSRLLPQSELVNKNTYVEKIDDETIRVHVRMEFKELIGMYRPASLSPDGENTQTEQIGGIE